VFLLKFNLAGREEQKENYIQICSSCGLVDWHAVASSLAFKVSCSSTLETRQRSFRCRRPRMDHPFYDFP
jgi:hypothetical protein